VIQLQANALRAAAAKLAPSNPRVVLIDAMGLYYRPPQAGGDRARGLDRWQDALRLFDTGSAVDVGWGHPEAYLWLSAVYSSNGDVAGARRALEKALSIRPDFVAARTALAALPKEGHPRINASAGR
jgi:hypothetical protein